MLENDWIKQVCIPDNAVIIGLLLNEHQACFIIDVAVPIGRNTLEKHMADMEVTKDLSSPSCDYSDTIR